MAFEKCGGEMRMRVQTLAGGFADQHAPFVIQADDARRETFAQRVSDKPRIALLPDAARLLVVPRSMPTIILLSLYRSAKDADDAWHLL